jgi:hypothetical protein
MHPALREASRALKARRGPATEEDRPQRKSRHTGVMKGQIDLFGNVHDHPDSVGL